MPDGELSFFVEPWLGVIRLPVRRELYAAREENRREGEVGDGDEVAHCIVAARDHGEPRRLYAPTACSLFLSAMSV